MEESEMEEKKEACCCEHEEKGQNCSHEHRHHHKEEKHEHKHGCCCCDDDDDDDGDCGCGCHSHGHSHEKEHDHEGHEHGHEHEEEDHDLLKIIGSAVLFAVALVFEHVPFLQNFGTFSKAVPLVLYCAAYLLCGLEVIKEAVEGLIHGEFFGEEFLMSIATIGAIVLGEYSEAVAVMVLFQLGEYLEGLAVGKSKASITKLMDIRPDKATVKNENGSEEVMAESVKEGQIIIVKPGERIPLDGEIISGSSMADTSALTGESVPREINAGDSVLSGFVNKNGVLEIRVTKEYTESTVSRILEMVENAQGKKAKVQRFVKRFAKVYTPIVCIIAAMVAVIPSVILGGGEVWKTWIYRALEILVVSCPCALVISVPLSFFAGIGLGSRNGILVKGSNYIELLSRTKTVFFDKTGTLTKGVFVVTDVHPAKGCRYSKEELVALAAHAEYFSNHPISRSLKEMHNGENCEICSKIADQGAGGFADELPGHGISCKLNGKTVLAGNGRLMEKESVSGFEPCDGKDGGTVVHVAEDGVYLGHIVISDVEKEDSADAVRELHRQGIEQVVMLTGDAKNAALAAGEKIGIDRICYELLPQDKVTEIEKIIDSYAGKKKSVVFVGDGVNDAPVLTRSDVGVAMGGIGSDAAIEAADVVIMDDRPSKLAVAVKVAKKTMANVWENVTFALLVKVLIMVLCAAGIANMWVAVFGDVGVTMLAVLNAMRLMKAKVK